MRKLNVKFEKIVTELQSLVATGNFKVEVQANITSTRYRTNSLEEALKRQVSLENVQGTAEEADEQVPTKRIVTITIIGLDSEETIRRKMDLAVQLWTDGEFEELLPSQKMMESENLIVCLDGFFGKGEQLDIEYAEAKEAREKEAQRLLDEANNSDEEVADDSIQDVNAAEVDGDTQTGSDGFTKEESASDF